MSESSDEEAECRPKKKQTKRRWSTEENFILYQQLKHSINNKVMPTSFMLDTAVKKLAKFGRSKPVIRTKINNIISGKQLFTKQ